MLETTPLIPDLMPESTGTDKGFQSVLDYIDEVSRKVVFTGKGKPQSEHFRIGPKAMQFEDDAKTALIVNDYVKLVGIPADAHRYVVNGRTPLEWFIDRYQIRQDNESGIVNDQNGWFAEPHEIVAAINRIVHVSVESTRIIEGLPARLNK